MKWVRAILIATGAPLLGASLAGRAGLTVGPYELFLLLVVGVSLASLAVGAWTLDDTLLAVLSTAVAMVLGRLLPESISWVFPLAAAGVVFVLIVRQRRRARAARP